jgi:predicted transcriptional regulator
MDSVAKGLKHLGPLEMAVLGQINGAVGSSVGDVQEGLRRGGKALAYTTVMTILGRLHKKGFLAREKQGRQHLYYTRKSPEKLKQSVLSKVGTSLFGKNRLRPILAL